MVHNMRTVTDLFLKRELDSVARLVCLYHVVLVYIEDRGESLQKDEPRHRVSPSVVPLGDDLVELNLVVALSALPLGCCDGAVVGQKLALWSRFVRKTVAVIVNLIVGGSFVSTFF